MIRYELKQKYPGSPKLGTKVYTPHREKAYLNDEQSVYKEYNTKNCRNFIFYSREYIENHPKFWKKL